MPRHALHGRGWIAALAVVVIIAVHIGLVSLVPRNPKSLALLTSAGIAIVAVKYVTWRRRS